MGTSINNTGGSFVIEISGYGGEVVLGTITETQYKVWESECFVTINIEIPIIIIMNKCI